MGLRINFAALINLFFGSFAFAAVPTFVSLLPEKSTVEFLAVGRPSALKIKGEGAKAEGQLKLLEGNLSGELKTDLDQFQTGIKLRDRHMKEKYLETGKEGFKMAVLKVIEAKVPDNFLKDEKGVQNLPFKGSLKLHGVEKEIGGIYSAKPNKDGTAVEGEAQFKIKLTDFGVAIPSFSGITVAEDVELKTRFSGKIDKDGE